MQPDLKGKVALVTGASKGIGLAVAEALVACGASVAISARNTDEIAEAGRRLESAHPKRVLARASDVRREKDVEALFRAVDDTFGGGPDMLINNAGAGSFKNPGAMTLEEWNSIIETNVTGVFLCCRAAIPRMRQRGGGYIINMSSLAGRNAFPQATAYNASKFALNGISEALMQEVRYDKFRVTYIM